MPRPGKPTPSLLPPILAAAMLATLTITGCEIEGPPPPSPETPTATAAPDAPPTAPEADPAKEWALAIHGGVGTSPGDGDATPWTRSLSAVLERGRDLLEEGSAALDVVEELLVMMEDDPLFNAGRGAVFSNRGTHELDAAIMDGRTLACGAVAGIRNVRNPIGLARAVMQDTPNVLLAGDGADEFSREAGVRRAPQDYFTTQRRFAEWQQARRRPGSADGSGDFGSVGVVALDQYGNLAAGTSSGGVVDRRHGRIGEASVIGAGIYADNASAAISGAGRGEELIRHAAAHSVHARMATLGEDVATAARSVVRTLLAEGDGGVIAVDARGTIAMEFSTSSMMRGAADSEGLFVTALGGAPTAEPTTIP